MTIAGFHTISELGYLLQVLGFRASAVDAARGKVTADPWGATDAGKGWQTAYAAASASWELAAAPARAKCVPDPLIDPDGTVATDVYGHDLYDALLDSYKGYSDATRALYETAPQSLWPDFTGEPRPPMPPDWDLDVYKAADAAVKGVEETADFFAQHWGLVAAGFGVLLVGLVVVAVRR